MKLPRDLRGKDLAQALCRDWGYRIVHQQRSHIILQTEGHCRVCLHFTISFWPIAEKKLKGLKGREILAINLRSECVKSALLRLVSM